MNFIAQKTALPTLCIGLVSIFVASCQFPTGTTTSVTPNPNDKAPQEQQLPDWSPIPLNSLPEAKEHGGTVLAAKENPNARGQLVSVGSDGSIIGWDLRTYTGHLISSLAAPISLATLGERTSMIASYGTDGISVSCLVGCSQTWHLSRLKIKPTALAFQGNDSALLIAGADGRVYRWRFLAEKKAQTVEEHEKILERYVAHQNIVSAVASHPFGRVFFSGDWNGALFGWLPYDADTHGGAYDRNLFGSRFYSDKVTLVQALRKADRGISAMTVSSSGERLGLGTEDGSVEVWEVKGFVHSAKESLHRGRVLSVSFDENARRIASVGRDMMVSVATLERDPSFGIAAQAKPWKLIQSTHQRIENAKDVLFLQNGNLIVTTSDGAVAEISDLKAPAPEPTPTPRTTDTAVDSDY
jgi:WD40 repeat protein